MDNNNQARTASIINVIAGIWLIISPYALGFTNPATQTNNLWLGFIVGILALIRAIWPKQTVWASWVNIIAGIWLIIAPFVLGFTLMSQRVNDVIVGVIVAALAIWSSGATMTSPAGRHAHA